MTGKTITYRLAKFADLELVKQLTEAAYASYTGLLGAHPLPVTEDYQPRVDRGEVWLAHASDELVGLIVLELHPDHAFIYSVAVAPEQQGRGYGLALLRFADDEARKSGVAEVRLYTNVRMERNLALYTAFGYREVGRRPNPYRPDFNIVDMTKRIV